MKRAMLTTVLVFTLVVGSSAWAELSGFDIGGPSPAGSLPTHLKTIARTQGLSAYLQFINSEVHNLLAEQQTLANARNVYLPRTIVDNFNKRGGDAAMDLNS